MKLIHDAVYFKCNGKRFYLENGVHQGSPINPALFDIYMENVIAEVLLLDLKSGKSYTLIYINDSITPAPLRVLGDTT
jgi:hypothetical protein